MAIVPPFGMASRALRARFEDDQLELAWVDFHAPQVLGKGALNLYVAAQTSIQQFPHVAGQPLEIHRLRLQCLTPRKRQQLAAQAGSTVDRLTHGREDLFPARGIVLAPQHLQAPRNDLQQVVEVVSDSARELPQRFKLLRLAQAVFHRSALGGIGNDADNACGDIIDIKGAPPQVHPSGFGARALADSRLDVDLPAQLCLRKSLPHGPPVLLHDVFEGHVEVPEGLDAGISEDLVMPGRTVHCAGREVKLPAAHAGRLQCDLQEFCGVDCARFHEALYRAVRTLDVASRLGRLSESADAIYRICSLDYSGAAH